MQLGPDLTFEDAAGIVDYLDDLGISDLYVSPVLAPAPGVTHGYHVADPGRVNEGLGGDAGLAVLDRALTDHGIGLLLDVVPNHLAAHPANPWWRDVLTHGPAARWAVAFDIDWAAGGGRVVLPVLGRPLDEAVAGGEIRIVAPHGEPRLVYHDSWFPLTPTTHEQAAAADARDVEAITALLGAQHYELCHWRTGIRRLNYRRFFDITDLVGVRVEDPDVFRSRHALILGLVERGVVTGLRVDHIDGLRDPWGYLETLDAALAAAGQDAGYVVVEKIVEGDEPLPEGWPVAGTTGYELLSAANEALTDADGLADLDRAYRAFTGFASTTPDVLHERKVAALEELFVAEVDGLVRRLTGLAARIADLPARDADALEGALVALTACFPVYRTYIRDGELRAEDRRRLAEAFAEARRRHPDLDADALATLERVLTLGLPDDLEAELRRDWLDIVLRWQQLTGPAMAKGFEDTTFYRVNRLVSLNEVGVDAHGIDEPGGIDSLHERLAARAAAWPHAMNTTSTHDTKRSEDVRARIAVLSEIPDRWASTVTTWHERTAAARRRLDDGRTAPDRDDEWRLYQTLVGMWPLDGAEEVTVGGRLARFAVKAAREAKVNTSWLDPDGAYEGALEGFVAALVDDRELIGELRDLLEEIALPGVCNSLAQLTWKVLAPGVPDVYQGCELWDWSLVDPDNRRPVDHDLRARLLGEVSGLVERDRLAASRELRDTWWDGRIKLHVTRELLGLRRRREALFRDGAYRPLSTDGEHASRVVAFAREDGQRWAAAIGPRLVAGLTVRGNWPTGDVWADTTLEVPAADGPVVEVLTGRRVDVDGGRARLADVLSRLPVAALVGPA